MPRLAFSAARAAVLGAALIAAAAQAPAQTQSPTPAPRAAPEAAAPAPESEGGVNAVEWIRNALANPDYDPQDRARARNYAPELEGSTHWRSSIFDGRRSRATTGTGLRLPNFPRSGGE
jgi:hypothetical protein